MVLLTPNSLHLVARLYPCVLCGCRISSPWAKFVKLSGIVQVREIYFLCLWWSSAFWSNHVSFRGRSLRVDGALLSMSVASSLWRLGMELCGKFYRMHVDPVIDVGTPFGVLLRKILRNEDAICTSSVNSLAVSCVHHPCGDSMISAFNQCSDHVTSMWSLRRWLSESPVSGVYHWESITLSLGE